MVIYHIAQATDWQKTSTKEEYKCSSLDIEGFIHCSKEEQLLSVANSFYKERKDLVLLGLDTNKIRPRVSFENLEGGSELFPHIYGPINMDAILSVHQFVSGEDGLFSFPKCP